MPRIPELGSLLGIGSPVEFVAPAFGSDLGKLLRLDTDRILGAMKFQKKRRLLGIGETGIGVAGLDLHVIQKLDTCNGYAHLDRHDDCIAGIFDSRKRADAATDLFRDTLQLQRHRGDDAERAFCADEKSGQVITRRRLLGTARGADFLTVGSHHGERKNIVLHSAVTHRVRARSAGRSHTADGGIGAGIDREEKPRIAQFTIKLFTGNAGLNRDIEVFRTDAQHLVHPRKINRNTAGRRIHLTFERGADTERDDGDAMFGTDPDDQFYVFASLNEDDAIRQLRRQIGGGVGMLFAKRLAGLETIRERLLQNPEDSADTVLVARARLNVPNCHVEFSCMLSRRLVRRQGLVCPAERRSTRT
ncbi:hypothetical protein D3C80_462540 [compost metagenome]